MISISCAVGNGEVGDGEITVCIEPADLGHGLDSPTGAPAGNEHDNVDGIGDQTARNGDHAFGDELLDAIERGTRGIGVPDGPVRVKAAEAEVPGEQIPDEAKAKAASLDAARIAAIRNDTERVSSVLGEIFSTDEDVSDEATAAHALPSSMTGLDPKHALLVGQIIQREHWTDEEFDELAGKQGLMPSGALEAINEWAFEKFDEALLDEYDGYDVSPDMADTLRAEMAKGD